MYSSDPKADLCSDSEHKQPLGLGRPPDHLWACNTYAKVFHSYSQAAAQGFLSKSQWKKRGREPILNCPAAMIVRRKGKSLGWDISPILDDLGDGVYIVALDYCDVFHQSHTVPIGSNHSHCQKDIVPNIALPHCHVAATESVVKQAELSECQEGNNANSTVKKSSPFSHTSFPITSIVCKTEEQTEVSAGKTQGFSVINSREFRFNNVGAFVPENFSKRDEQWLGKYKEEAFCIMHNMHLFRVRSRQPKDAWIDLSFEFCMDRFPHWRQLRPLLLDGILERIEVESFPELGIILPRGVKGSRCYGYRFASEEYRNARVRKRPITDPKLVGMIEAHRNVKYPVQRWLERNLQQVTIDDVPDVMLFDMAVDADDPLVRYYTYQEQVELIQDKSWVFVVDEFARRVHTNLTALKRELRAYLRVAGKPLVQIDIKNSQPLFLGLAARKCGGADRRYLELCQQDLYQHLADLGGFTRQEVKEQLTQKALFAANRSPHQRLPVKKLFDAEFPQMAGFIRDTKTGQRSADNPKPHNKLAKLAQKTEANFLIYSGVCERIRHEKPECWVSTIHDSILVQPEWAEYVRGVMLDEFGKLGVQPRLEVEACDR